MLGMWEILGHSSRVSLSQRSSRIGLPQISNFCIRVIGTKFGNDFNFGQSQIFKIVFCFWVVGLIWSDYGGLWAAVVVSGDAATAC